MFRHGHASRRRLSQEQSRDADAPLDGLFRALRSRTAQRGELRLALAVLEDAVRCLDGNQDPWHIPPRLFRWEAAQWIASRDREPLFSFESICSILRLDAEDLRERIRRWGAFHGKEPDCPI